MGVAETANHLCFFCILMKHHVLREIAKIGTGLVLADLIGALWFSSAGLLPLTLLGISWTAAMVPEILVFDIVLLLLLTHFGWGIRLLVASPSERTLLTLSGIIFLVVALAHLTRLLFGLGLIFGTVSIPLWLSWAGFFLTGYLSYASFHFANMRRR